MIRYTTPTVTLIYEGIIPLPADVWVSLRQGKTKLHKKNPTVMVGEHDTTILVPLTQEETAAFDTKAEVDVQINWITPSETRDASGKTYVPSFENLLDEVIHYGD